MDKPRTRDNRKSLLVRIHIGKKQLGLDDELYRDMLKQVTGKNSCAKMHISELYLVLERLKKSGFKAKGNIGKRPRPAKNKAALISKVEALLADSELPWNYAHAMAQRMFKVEKVDWLEAEQLHKLVAALNYQAKRSK